MAIFLYVISILIVLFGLGILSVATSVLHEIFGAIGIVTAAILFSSGGIISEIAYGRKEQLKLFTEIRNKLKGN